MQQNRFTRLAKRNTLWVTAALTSALSVQAHAQSNVTLYGIVDDGFGYVSNLGGGRAFQEESGKGRTERWGLRGTEDLGDGLTSLFVLENSFSSNTGKIGTAGREFGRQAFVGLKKKGSSPSHSDGSTIRLPILSPPIRALASGMCLPTWAITTT